MMTSLRWPRRTAALPLGILLALTASCGGGSGGSTSDTPNILFVIMDDVGIDQMAVFGYGGETPPGTPNIAAIADAGIRFHNTWSMPACTTSRAVIFEAQYPLRTNIKGALGPSDLANSMVSPYEVTVPKLLATRGYESALFGKFHLGLQGNDPAGYGMPHNLGWNYFAGWLDETGDPSSIDSSAGGVAPPGTWDCGFVPGADQGGADSGACYQPDGSCEAMVSQGPVPPGRTCRDEGGVFDPNQACQDQVPSYIDFEILSGHYVNPLVYNYPDGTVEVVPLTDSRARQFRAAGAVDDAIDWILDRPDDKPWMATVSFASAHTPVMQVPLGEAPGSATSSTLDCLDVVDQRELTNQMIESIDFQVGRLLVETGLARRGRDGRLVYRPDNTDTVVVIVGDNGSLGNSVKLPFQISRSKGSAYQTGVWVPLLVSGPLVRQPGRVVTHMVNHADLFALFGEIAGIEDVQAAVPRPIDAMPMLPYLRNPDQQSIRAWNYTEIGINLQIGELPNQPCVISGGCTQIPVSKSVCEDNNGVWWGAGADAPETEGIPAEGYTYCCQVNAFRDAEGQSLYTINPLVAVGIRNDRYKIVQNQFNAYVSQEQPCVETTETEFYEIDQAVPDPRLDYEGTNFPLDDLTDEQQRNYDALSAQLQAIRDSVPYCPGDGNSDLAVNQLDIDDWRSFADGTGLSSWYDLNLDGLTNDSDRDIIEDNLGLMCSTEQTS